MDLGTTDEHRWPRRRRIRDGGGGHLTLMGATTYRLMSGFAAEMPDAPGLGPLTGMPKVVFSSTLDAPLGWANTELVRGDAVQAVRRMKREESRPLRTFGSVSLCRALLGAGVVDRFRVVLFPVITGATGRNRIFDGLPDIRLELVAAGPSTGGSSCASTCRRCSTSHRVWTSR